MKSQLLEFPFVLATQGIHCPAESRMIVSWAAIFSPLMPGGCIKSSQCQWWSRLFSIGQLVWEEDGSLSKTTKLLLLDSLLQEVCIESGSDGSLALSLLGLSVCLVSHNLLYSGLKKAHSTLKFIMNKNSECLNIYAKWPSKIFEDYFCKSTIGIALKNVGVHDLLGWQMQAVPDFTAVFF